MARCYYAVKLAINSSEVELNAKNTVVTGTICSLLVMCALMCFTGRFGGIVAANQLRCLLGTLGCISVTEILSVPLVHEALDSDGTPNDDWLVPGAQKFIRDLEWHSWAMKARRETHGLPRSS